MWKFYDAFAGGSVGYKETEGPMPCKRWIADGKRHRLHYHSPKHPPRTPTTNEQFERKAAEYAEWLAKRDSVTLPEAGRVCVHWSGVCVMRPDSRGTYEKRIRAVSFGDVTIDLPNWDFIAAPNVDGNKEAARRKAA